jgi:hypothetical protein
MNTSLPTTIYKNEITDASAWQPSELCPSQTWSVTLTDEHVDELLSGLDQVQGFHIAEINPANFPIPACQNVIEQIYDELRVGRGFALMHGFPVDGIAKADISRMYWGFCSHLGGAVTQNSDGGLIHHVTEGRLRPNQGTRSVGHPGHVSLHADLADAMTLLCVRQASDSPRSQLVSSSTIHNALRERHSDKLHRLYDGFPWDRQNEHDKTETPTTVYPVPVFSQTNDLVSSRYNRNWISKAADRAGGLSPEDETLLNLLDELAQEFCFSFDFQPGDVQFANNYIVWHGREAHTPAKGENDTRLLMRIWLNLDDIRAFANELIIRHGVIKHGKLGWSAADVLKGLDGRIHHHDNVA